MGCKQNEPNETAKKNHGLNVSRPKNKIEDFGNSFKIEQGSFETKFPF